MPISSRVLPLVLILVEIANAELTKIIASGGNCFQKSHFLTYSLMNHAPPLKLRVKTTLH